MRRRAGAWLRDLGLVVLAAGVAGLVVLALQPRGPGDGTAVLSPTRSATSGTTTSDTTAAAVRPSPSASPSPAVAGPPPATAALGDGLLSDSEGWYRRLLATDDAPLREVLNAGRPGQTSAEVAARVSTVVAASPQVTVVQAGTNDLLRGIPTATTVASLRRIATTLQGAGVVPVLALVPPNNALRARVGPLNAGIAALGEELDVLVVDPWEPVRRPDGAWLTGSSADGVEPTPAASQQAAEHAAGQLATADLPTG